MKIYCKYFSDKTVGSIYLVSDNLQYSIDVDDGEIESVLKDLGYHERIFKEYIKYVELLPKMLGNVFSKLIISRYLHEYEANQLRLHCYEEDGYNVDICRAYDFIWHLFPSAYVYSNGNVKIKEFDKSLTGEYYQKRDGSYSIKRIKTVSFNIRRINCSVGVFARFLNKYKTVENIADELCSIARDFVSSYNSAANEILRKANNNYEKLLVVSNLDLLMDKYAVKAYQRINSSMPRITRWDSCIPLDRLSIKLNSCAELLKGVAGATTYPRKGHISVNEICSLRQKDVRSDIYLTELMVDYDSKIKQYIVRRLLNYDFITDTNNCEAGDEAEDYLICQDLDDDIDFEAAIDYGTERILSECVFNGTDKRYNLDSMHGRLEAVFCNRDLSYAESDEILRIMKEYRLTLTGCDDKYCVVDLPFVSMNLLGIVVDCWLESIKDGNYTLSSIHSEYNSKSFLKRFVEFFKVLDRYKSFAEEVYDLYSDVVDYLLFHFKESEFYMSEAKYNINGLSILKDMQFGLVYDGKSYSIVHFSLRLNGVDSVY